MLCDIATKSADDKKSHDRALEPAPYTFYKLNRVQRCTMQYSHWNAAIQIQWHFNSITIC